MVGSAPTDLPVSLKEIHESLLWLRECEGTWDQIFADLGIIPLTLQYEDVVSHPGEAIASVLQHLGITQKDALILHARTPLLRDARSGGADRRIPGVAGDPVPRGTQISSTGLRTSAGADALTPTRRCYRWQWPENTGWGAARVPDRIQQRGEAGHRVVSLPLIRVWLRSLGRRSARQAARAMLGSPLLGGSRWRCCAAPRQWPGRGPVGVFAEGDTADPMQPVPRRATR